MTTFIVDLESNCFDFTKLDARAEAFYQEMKALAGKKDIHLVTREHIDLHRERAARLFNVPLADVTTTMRNEAKRRNYMDWYTPPSGPLGTAAPMFWLAKGRT